MQGAGTADSKTSSMRPRPGSPRLSKAGRRTQLLDTAFQIVREEGADRLTLGHLADRARVSKPIAYEHFGTRSGLLIELYKTLDARQIEALQLALGGACRSLQETADTLAAAYVHCSADTSGEWHAIGAALSGSEEMGAVLKELLANYVQLFVDVLQPHTSLPPAELGRRCVGIVGAAEALTVMMVRRECTEAEAAHTLSALIQGAIQNRVAPLN